jgi:Ran GTPase-activating protein (RanGAP) involved in mRNA processing and transport
MICDLINRCPTLVEIQLQNNNIDNNGAITLVESIRGRKITKLDVDNNKISGDVLSALLQIVPVRKLNLVRNKLSDSQVEPLKQSLMEHRDLKILYMSHNNISDRALGMLAEGLQVNLGIEEIQFTHNDLSVPNGLVFINALKSLPKLSKLSLNSCNLIVPCLQELKDSLIDNEVLTDISLYSNEIDAEGAQLIA